MRRTTGTGRVAATLLAAALCAAAGTVDAAPLDEKKLQRCMESVVRVRGEAKGLGFEGHDFNCKALSYWKTTNGVTEIRGTLSHALTARPDDQVDWSFKLDANGVVRDVRLKIRRGGAGAIVKRLRPPVLVQRGVPLNPDGMDQFFRWSGEIWDGKWESKAHALVGGIAASLSYSRAAARENAIGRTPIYYYNVAPRERGPYRREIAKNPAQCREKCVASRSCAVWSFQNRRMSDGKAGERHCKLFSSRQHDGFRSQTRSVSGRVR